MFALRPHLADVLSSAATATSDVALEWLDAPPPDFDTLRRSVRLPRSADLGTAGASLLSWDLHRRAGLRVLADGPARRGTTVAVAARVGPVWAVAPCRVVEAIESQDQVGFTYATLPGHPEHGLDYFKFVRDESGLRFDVQAASRPALLVSRVFPFPQRSVQALWTRRYLQAALAVANT